MPKKIIKDGHIQQDIWQLISQQDIESNLPLPEGNIIVPLSVWQQDSEKLSSRTAELGVWLNSDEGPEAISADLDQFAIIAIHFPAFTDGRGYSYARLLRERYNYQGDIRAFGDVLQDQLQHMLRCGFTSFAIKEGKNIEAALAGLKTINEAYQAATDVSPLFRRRTK